MNYTCSLQNLVFHGFHGLHPEEALTGGLFQVDIHIETTRTDEENFNHIGTVLNYETIYALIKTEMSHRSDLIESVASRIISRVYQVLPEIRKVTVSITKPNPGGLFKSGEARVTLSR